MSKRFFLPSDPFSPSTFRGGEVEAFLLSKEKRYGCNYAAFNAGLKVLWFE